MTISGKNLFLASFLYLCFPTAIFLLTWITPWVALPVFGVLVAFVWQLFRTSCPDPSQPFFTSGQIYFTPLQGGLLVLGAGIACVLAGAGGWAFQRSDYEKHNAILKELLLNDWPVVFQNISFLPEATTHLNYYLAYYLPIAWAARFTGMASVEYWAFAWTILGFVLVLLWICLLNPKFRWVALVAFFFFNGMDVLVIGFELLVHTLSVGFDPDFWYHQARTGWSVALANKMLRYTGMYNLLIWTPQHALGGWLATCLFAYERWHWGTAQWMGVVVVLLLFWSPFAAVGLALFGGVSLLWAYHRSVWSWQNLVAAPLLAVVFGAMYLAHAPVSFKGWTWEWMGLGEFLWKYPVFMALQVWGFAWLMWPYLRNTPMQKWLVAIVALLSIFPCYKLGYNNDFLMHISIPYLFLFSVLLGYAAALQGEASAWKARLLLFFWLLGAVDPLRNLAIPLLRPVLEPSLPTSVKVQDNPRLGDLVFPADVGLQYLGLQDSFYARYLLKQGKPSATGE